MDHGSCGNSSISRKARNGNAANCCGSGDKTAAAAGNNNSSCKDDEEQAMLIAEMKSKLTPMEYQVTQGKVTERPFSNRYNRHFEPGSYHCVVCDTELFKSETKFESKSGWPAFFNVVDNNRIKLKADTSHVGANILLLISRPDLARNEVSCAFCKSHLGHLFQDGPKPTGLRYCVNSNSLIFHPKSESEESDARSEADTRNQPTNTNGISDPRPPTLMTATSCISSDQTDKSDNLPCRAAVGENIPSGKICININSSSNGTNGKEKNSSVPRRDSGSNAAGAASNSAQNKGKFCIFSQCLPKEATATTSSPETSPSTQKHYYKPSSTNNGNGNGKSVTENNAANNNTNRNTKEPEPNALKSDSVAAAAAVVAGAVSRKGRVKGRAPPPPTLNLRKDENLQDQGIMTVRRFGTDVPSPTSETFETLTRRPSNGVLRETFL